MASNGSVQQPAGVPVRLPDSRLPSPLPRMLCLPCLRRKRSGRRHVSCAGARRVCRAAPPQPSPVLRAASSCPFHARTHTHTHTQAPGFPRGTVIKTKPRVERNRVLVTGGAGFVGSHLCEFLVNRGDHVRVVSGHWWHRTEEAASAARQQQQLVTIHAAPLHAPTTTAGPAHHTPPPPGHLPGQLLHRLQGQCGPPAGQDQL
jgi:hypothetical protein